jgi:hypothetical protein
MIAVSLDYNQLPLCALLMPDLPLTNAVPSFVSLEISVEKQSSIDL